MTTLTGSTVDTARMLAGTLERAVDLTSLATKRAAHERPACTGATTGLHGVPLVESSRRRARCSVDFGTFSSAAMSRRCAPAARIA